MGFIVAANKEERSRLEEVMRQHHELSAKEICKSLVDYALKRDDELRRNGEQDRIDDKTVLIIKRF